MDASRRFVLCSSLCSLMACSQEHASPGLFDHVPDMPSATTDSGGGDEEAATTTGIDPAPPDLGSVAEPCGCDAQEVNVITCNGDVVEACEGAQACDPETLTCADACDLSAANRSSTGCEFHPVYMDSIQSETNVCFATFIVNASAAPAHLSVSYNEYELDVEEFAAHPVGTGPTLAWKPYDATEGLAPGEAVGLFLVGSSSGSAAAPCPVPAALVSGVALSGVTGIGRAFQITSDVPVAAYQFNPYRGGAAAPTTGASMLWPVSAWGTNYMLVSSQASGGVYPSLNIVGGVDEPTTVTLRPAAQIYGGGLIPSIPPQTPANVALQSGWHAQLTEPFDLTGSVVQADQPIGVFTGHRCAQVPFGYPDCDHVEEMLPPISAAGSEYVGVMHRPRAGEPAVWRMVGLVDGTSLGWSTQVGGPTTLMRGQTVEFTTAVPFVVQSQGSTHPFLLMSYMSSHGWSVVPNLANSGDPELVVALPSSQFMRRYTFFTDPAFPETNLVVVRAPRDGEFHDVVLDCAGAIGGWTSLGSYEWARVDLSTGNFTGVGDCSTGAHEMHSDAPFGLYVWGWGTPLTSIPTAGSSYGYAAGGTALPINDLVIPAL